VHRATWPQADALRELSGDAEARMLGVVGSALAGVRKAKSEAKVSQRTEVVHAVVSGPAGDLTLVGAAAADLRGAGRIAELSLTADGDELAVRDVTLSS
jgi:valyl-tRNA synthetase